MPEEEFEHYLSLMTRLLRLSPAQRDEVAAELRDHLEERLDDLIASGLTREAAIRATLAEFGDTNELAQHLTQASGVGKRRRIMRFTVGTVAVMTICLALATAFWPENQNAPAPLRSVAPRRVVAQNPGAPAAPPTHGEVDGAATRGMRGQTQPRPKKRFMARLQHLPSTDLANTLHAHFLSEDVKVVSEPVSNTVLIETTTELVDEVSLTIRELDQPAQPLDVEVTVLELDASEKAEIGLAKFRGSSKAVRAQIDALQKADHVVPMRFQLSTVNNQQAEMRHDNDHGRSTTVSCIPRISGPSNSVTMSISIRDIHHTAEGKPGEKKMPDANATCQTTLTIPNDHSVVAGQFQQNGVRIVFLVSVKFDPTAK
jgi:hypothetical protein